MIPQFTIAPTCIHNYLQKSKNECWLEASANPWYPHKYLINACAKSGGDFEDHVFWRLNCVMTSESTGKNSHQIDQWFE